MVNHYSPGRELFHDHDQLKSSRAARAGFPEVIIQTRPLAVSPLYC